MKDMLLECRESWKYTFSLAYLYIDDTNNFLGIRKHFKEN